MASKINGLVQTTPESSHKFFLLIPDNSFTVYIIRSSKAAFPNLCTINFFGPCKSDRKFGAYLCILF